jgi:hypothetical protein
MELNASAGGEISEEVSWPMEIPYLNPARCLQPLGEGSNSYEQHLQPASWNPRAWSQFIAGASIVCLREWGVLKEPNLLQALCHVLALLAVSIMHTCPGCQGKDDRKQISCSTCLLRQFESCAGAISLNSRSHGIAAGQCYMYPDCTTGCKLEYNIGKGLSPALHLRGCSQVATLGRRISQKINWCWT